MPRELTSIGRGKCRASDDHGNLATQFLNSDFSDAAALGINDVMAPDFGEPVPVEDGEIPVFWACGVTPQMAIKKARPDICITHAPGFMVITDIAASELAAGRGPEISSAPQSN